MGGYFAILLCIAWRTGRNADGAAYFLGNRASPWYAVAFGMIGDSLSGVTFISVPGAVGRDSFGYLQIVLGYVLGYVVIAAVLLPLYYSLNLTSIYAYLRQRFGPWAQRSGSAFFLISRTLGAAARLYLASSVVQAFVFDAWGLPYWVSVAAILALILGYTIRGGIKTLVWTDTFQSTCLLLGVLLSIAALMGRLDLGAGDFVRTVTEGPHAQVFFWDWRAPDYFWKHFTSGALIAVVMTGLDQNMMQKNLSCRSLREAQINMVSFGFVVVLVNLLFLALGALLHAYAAAEGVGLPARSDELFPLLALEHLGGFAAVAFLLGLTAATFSSADSVLTTLTTSFCLDILHLDEGEARPGQRLARVRHGVHALFAVLLFFVILGFRAVDNAALITVVLALAGYTYGPLLGLFAFGLVCDTPVRDRWVPLVCVASPLICYALAENAPRLLGGYRFGFELLLLNGLLTAAGLWLLRLRPRGQVAPVQVT
jgi:Na+/proline symporter